MKRRAVKNRIKKITRVRTYSKFRSIVAWLFVGYAAIVVLFNMPFMQRTLGNWAATALSNQLDTKVEIGSVNVGFLTHLIVDDLSIEDKNKKEMLKVARTTVSINLLKLLSTGDIEINAAQLFGAKANLYKSTPKDDYNFQFVIDAFKSEDKEPKPIHLCINSLIVRHADIKHNILSAHRKPSIDPNHLDISDAGFNLSLKAFSPDSLNLSLKRFQAKELNSGLDIRDLAFRIIGNKTDAVLQNFILSLPQSTIQTEGVAVHYPDFPKDRSFSFSETHINASVNPTDLTFLTEKVASLNKPIDLYTTLYGTDKKLEINEFTLSSPNNGISADINAAIVDYTTSSPTFNATINALHIPEGEIAEWTSPLMADNSSLAPLFNAGNINYTGNVRKSERGLYSDGDILTDAGTMKYHAKYGDDKLLEANIETTDLNLSRILQNDHFGNLTLTANALVDMSQQRDIPVGKVQSTINTFDYNGYKYSGINVEAINNASDITLHAASDDDNLNFTLDGTLSNFSQTSKNITGSLNVKNINPHLLGLTSQLNGESLSFDANGNVRFTDINNLAGAITLNNAALHTANDTYHIGSINADALLNGTSSQHLNITSDFLDADVTGRFRLDELATHFQNIIAYHLPHLLKHKPSSSTSDIKYDITFRDAPFIHHFLNQDYTVSQPVNIHGSLDSDIHSLNMTINAPELSYNNNEFQNLRLSCSSNSGNMMATLTGANANDKSSSSGKIVAIAHNDKVDSDIQLLSKSRDVLDLNLFATTTFTNEGGNLMTSVNLAKSTAKINGDTWTISPSTITYCNNNVECHNFKIGNGNQYLQIDGKASPNPNDSLIAVLNDIEVAYILDLVNFHSVRFGGKASGRAVANNIFGSPDAYASLYVENFSLQDGVMGNANINAFWDKEKEGIALNAHIVDAYTTRVGLTNTIVNVTGITDVLGHILPGKKELDLHVNTDHTHTDFLKGFLHKVFKDVEGSITGPIDVVGPFNDINLIGNPKADLALTLYANNVPYLLQDETVHLDYHEFSFDNITLHDRQNNSGILNGKVRHRNFTDFNYNFDVDLKNLCAYNETEFNSDKFLASFWANGDISITGSDGRPLYINANVSPCRSSVFAYDAATPDALVNSTFITFRDTTALSPSQPYSATTTLSPLQEYEYLGDIYMDVNIDLNPNCDVKLRMDNTKDGYLSTRGYGSIKAKYYNKGSFQLFGNYNITSGKYRLYLTDVTSRDLDIQERSTVEFNGNPFDANIHLICKHDIQSVPLSELTGTTAFSSNNSVKVECLLDIVGHLDNMELSFNFELPTVSEETRQLVRSLINSDEEMNKQMISLLGFHRFYPNELSQNNMEDYGTTAISSLLSSTISGQINQALSNMLGSKSKWNFGTGFTTGQNGLEDLDVEGILSGRLLNDRLLINGNFGYRDNSLTNQANFIGDFEIKYRLWESGDFYVKAYNQTNDRYFTKATLNTQGVGLNFQHDFERYTLLDWFRRRKTITPKTTTEKTDSLK